MKKISFTDGKSKGFAMTIFLPVAAIVFLLQGCCFGLGPSMGKKSCNCNGDKPEYAVNNKTASQADAGQTVTEANGNSTQIINSGQPSFLSGETINPVTNTIAADPAVQTVQTLPHISVLTFQNETSQENKQSDFLKYNNLATHKTVTGKKLPLGIKAIRSHISAGPSISFKSSKEDYGSVNHKSKPGVGFQFGFGSSYFFSDQFAVAPSLLYKHNSGTETISYPGTGGSGGTEYKSTYSYSFLSVPILAEIRLSDQFTALAGPEVNFLMSASVKSGGYAGSEKTDIKDNSIKTGVGAQVGIKYAIPGSPLGVQLIYDHRISRLNEKNSSDYTGGGNYDNPAWNMKSIQLALICALCELFKNK